MDSISGRVHQTCPGSGRLSAILVLWFFVFNHVTTAKLLSEDEMKRLSNDLGKKLTDYTRSVTGVDMLTQAYSEDEHAVTFQSVKGDELVRQAANSLGEIFRKKVEALKRAAKRAEELTVHYHWNTSIKNDSVHYLHAKELNESSPQFEYFEEYQQKVNMENSSVHIPVDIYKGDVEILNSLAWTKNLDQIWKENRERDPTLLWQYFGSQTGILRSYPASKWRGKSRVDLFDVRRRPWSGSSHGQALALMKHSVKSIIDTLGENDFVNVANFSEKASLVGCFSTFVQATARNKQKLVRFVDTMWASGVASFAVGLEFAFEQFINFTISKNRSEGEGTQCNQVIMFLTDGGTEMPVEIIKRYNPDRKIRIFSFAVGPIASAIPAVKWIGCSNRDPDVNKGTLASGGSRLGGLYQMHGYFYQIPAMGAIRSKVQDYLSVLARPRAHATNNSYSTCVHLDEMGMGLVTSVAMPVFNRSTDIGYEAILGVIGVDVLIKELTDSLPKHKFGPTGYCFAVNSNGYVVFHPGLKTDDDHLQNPPNIDFLEIEPETPEKVMIRRDMIDQRSNSVRISSYVIGLDEHHADIKTRIYHHTAIPHTNFSLALVLPEYAQYYVENIRHVNIQEAIAQLPSRQSALIAPYHLFCKGLPSNNPASASLDLFIKTVTSNYTQCKDYHVRQFLWDADITEHLEKNGWMVADATNSESFREGILARFVATNGGLTAVYPANSSDLFFQWSDSRDQVFYKRAFDNDNWMFSIQFPQSSQNVSWINRTILATRSTSIKSKNYKTAVVGVHLAASKFNELVFDVLSRLTDQSLLCYVLEDGGFITYSNNEDYNTTLTNFFGTVEPDIMLNLLDESVFIRHREHDYQSICPPIDTQSSDGYRLLTPFVYDVLSLNWWTTTTTWTYWNIMNMYNWLFQEAYCDEEEEEEESVLEDENRSCIKDHIQYHFNPKLDVLNRRGSVSCNNCTRSYVTSRIKDTNLLLVIADKVSDKIDCRCYYTPLPYQSEEIQDPLVDDQCHVTVRYRRRPPCYDTNTLEPSNVTYCAASHSIPSLLSVFISFFLVASS